MHIAEHGLRPAYGSFCGLVEAETRRPDHSLIVIAFDSDGASVARLGHDLRAGHRIGAVADDVSQEDGALRPSRPRVFQASLQGFEIGMDVGE